MFVEIHYEYALLLSKDKNKIFFCSKNKKFIPNCFSRESLCLGLCHEDNKHRFIYCPLTVVFKSANLPIKHMKQCQIPNPSVSLYMRIQYLRSKIAERTYLPRITRHSCADIIWYFIVIGLLWPTKVIFCKDKNFHGLKSLPLAI